MGNHYNVFAKRDSSTTFEFEGSEISLDIPEDGELTKEGWNITPITPTVVSYYVWHALVLVITDCVYSCVDYKEGGR